MNLKFIIIILIFVAILIAFLILSYGEVIKSDSNNKMALQKVSIAHGDTFAHYLIEFAKEQGLFEQEGIDVNLIKFPSGKRALVDGLYQDNEIDFAISAQIPIIFGILNEENIKIIATVGESFSDAQIVSKKSLGVNIPSDLIGKTIATQRGSSVHFFLNSFLIYSLINSDDVKIEYLKIEDMPLELFNDNIDAFSTRDPFTTQAQNLIPSEDIVIFYNPGNFIKTHHIVVNNKVLENDPKLVDSLLKAIINADNMRLENPDKFYSVAMNIFGYDFDQSFFDKFIFYISFEQSLLIDFNEKSNWAISTGLTKIKDEPNFVDFFYLDALENISPERISLIQE